MTRIITFITAFLCMLTFSAQAQISITSLAQVYNQDFNSLESSGNAGTAMPSGWAFSGVTTYRTNYGNTNNGGLYSFGDTATLSDRALGSIGSGSATPSFGAKFINNTGASITSISLSFNVENWRLGQKPALRLDSSAFSYNVNVDSLTATGWTTVSSLKLITPDTSASAAGALNGNLPINRLAVSGTISGLAIAPGANFWIRWTELNVSGSDDGLAVDDLSVSFTGGVLPACTEPASSVTNVVLNQTGLTSVSGSFTGTSPASDGYLVVLDSTATVPTITDATVYSVGQTIGSAVVISNGTATTFSRSGLVSNTVYKVHVFPYNNSGCTGGPNYKISAPGNDTAKTLVDACPEPTAKPTNLQFTFVDNTTITGKFNKAVPAPDGYVVVHSTSSNVGYPLDSTTYAVGDSVISGSFKSKVAYVGTDSNFTISGLVAGTRYYIAVVPYKTCGYGPNYLRTTPLRDDTTTTGGTPVCAEPDTITGITVTGTTDNSITATFTPHSGGADGYLVVYRRANSFLVGVNDATTYTVGQLLTQVSGGFTDSSVVGYIGTNTTFTLTGLLPGTTYHFAVFPFNNTGCSGGPNYKVRFSTNVNKTSGLTTGGPCVEPNAVPQNLVFNNVTGTSISGHFKQQTIADGYVVVVAKGFIANLRDSVVYAVGDSVGNSPKTYVAKVATSNLDTNFTITGLTPNTSYGVAVYSYKTCNGFRLYKSQIVPNVNKRDTTTATGTGVRYSTGTEFTVFPNPVQSGQLFMQFKQALVEQAVLEVIDVTGNRMMLQQLGRNITMHTLDVSAFAKGMYLINIWYKNENSTVPFMVE
jgi:hypothetical protein